MLSKNNYQEKAKLMREQAKREHFGIRKLAVGAVSVLLGFSFLGVKVQTAKADTLSKENTETTIMHKQIKASGLLKQDTTQAQAIETTDKVAQNKKAQNEPDVTTYAGLSSFLRGGEAGQTNEQVPAETSSNNATSANVATEPPVNTPEASQPATNEDNSSATSVPATPLVPATSTADKVATSRVNDIVIHHYLVDADGNPTTKPVTGLGDENGDTYVDGFVGDNVTVKPDDANQKAPEGFEILPDQESIDWTFAIDKNKEITYYYKRVPTAQAGTHPNTEMDTDGTNFADWYEKAYTSSDSVMPLTGEIQVGKNLYLEYFWGTTPTASLTTGGTSYLYGALPNYWLVDGNRNKITSSYFYNGSSYARILMGINDNVSALKAPSQQRLYYVGKDSTGTITVQWSADYVFSDGTRTIDFTGTMKPSGSLVDINMTARNSSGGDLSGVFFEWDADTYFFSDNVPFEYLGNNQGLAMHSNGYKLNMNFSKADSPTGWKAAHYALPISEIFPSPSSLGQKVNDIADAPAKGEIAFSSDTDNSNIGRSGDSAVYMIWNSADLDDGAIRNLDYQVSITDTNAKVPVVTLKDDFENSKLNNGNNDIVVNGKVTDEDPVAQVTAYYEIDGKNEQDVTLDEDDEFNLDAGKLSTDTKHQITIYARDQYGNTSETVTVTVYPAENNITVHYVVGNKDGADLNQITPAGIYDAKLNLTANAEGGINADVKAGVPVGYEITGATDSIGNAIDSVTWGATRQDVYVIAKPKFESNNITVKYVDESGNAIDPSAYAGLPTSLSGKFDVNATIGTLEDTPVTLDLSKVKILPGNHSYTLARAEDGNGNLLAGDAINEGNIQFDNDGGRVIKLVYKKLEFNGTPITVHADDIGNEKIPDFASSSKGTNFLTNTDHVKGVKLATDQKTITKSDNIGKQNVTGTVVVTLDDDSTVTLDNVKFNVVGASAVADGSVSVTSSSEPNTNLQADKLISANSNLDEFHPTYEFVSGGADGVPVNADGHPTFESEDGTETNEKVYIKVTYHEGSITGPETGSQTISVTVKVKPESIENGIRVNYYLLKGDGTGENSETEIVVPGSENKTHAYSGNANASEAVNAFDDIPGYTLKKAIVDSDNGNIRDGKLSVMYQESKTRQVVFYYTANAVGDVIINHKFSRIPHAVDAPTIAVVKGDGTLFTGDNTSVISGLRVGDTLTVTAAEPPKGYTLTSPETIAHKLRAEDENDNNSHDSKYKVDFTYGVVPPVAARLTVYQNAILDNTTALVTIINFNDLAEGAYEPNTAEWLSTPDTSRVGTTTATIRIYTRDSNLGNGIGYRDVTVPIKVIAKPGLTMADIYHPVGGIIEVPQYTDMPQDSTYAQAGIINNSDMPDGTTYVWKSHNGQMPDTSVVGSDSTGFVRVTFPDGSYKSVKVNVLVADNVTKDTTLKHNAYIYDANGKRANGITLTSGSSIKTSGIPVTINGEGYYALADGYIKQSNFAD